MKTRHLPNRHTPAEIDAIEQSSRLSNEWLQANYNESRAAGYRRAGAAARKMACRYAAPKVTRGEPKPEALIFTQDGSLKYESGEIEGRDKSGFVDWLNFTVGEESFFWNQGMDSTHVQELILEISDRCESWLGFGITAERETGANFYTRSWVLGDGVGMVCHGGQRGTVLFSLSGKACDAAKPGWESRIYEFLTLMASRPRISRCDVAYDCMDGVLYSVDQAFTDYNAGLFNCRARAPQVEQRGNWVKPSGKGRTLYIGVRANSGKYARIYEKGKQLGDKESPWVRIEVEFKSADRVIDFDILLKPGNYLAGAYTAFSWIRQEQQRIKTIKKCAEKSYAKTLEWVKRQAGPALWLIKEVEGGFEGLSKVIREGVMPKRCDFPHFSTMTLAIHHNL